MKTFQEVAAEEMKLGHVFVDGLGWTDKKALTEAKAFIESIRRDFIEAKKAYGYGIEVVFTSQSYGWGEQKKVSRFFMEK